MMEVLWVGSDGVQQSLFAVKTAHAARLAWLAEHGQHTTDKIMRVRSRKALSKDEIRMALEHKPDIDEELRFILLSMNERIP